MQTGECGSIIAGLLLSLTGKYKWIAISGLVIGIVGTVLLVRLNVASGQGELLVGMLVLGVYTVVVQNAYPEKIGVVSSMLVFFRQLGGAIGLAAMGSVLTSAYIPAFHSALPTTLKSLLPTRTLAAFDNPLVLLSPGGLAQIRAGFAGYGPQGLSIFNMLLQAVKMGLEQSIHNVFVLSLGVIIFGLIAVFFLKEIPLRERKGF